MSRKKNLLILLAVLAVVLSACATQPEVGSSLVGTMAPDFTLANTDGGQTSLSDYQGTPVLLFFHMAVG